VIDLVRQDIDAGMAYGLEPEPTSWPTACPEEGGWSCLPDETRRERTELADFEEAEVTERVTAGAGPGLPGRPDRTRLSLEDCWFFGAYRRYHAGLEDPAAGPEGWRPGRDLPVRRLGA
jgi:hypothetical protein